MSESPEKKSQAEQVVGEMLRLMGYPARLEAKDGADGGISLALFFEGEVPGAQPGRRSHLIDSLQFLANKIVNRPQTEKRWISLGVGGHPEPRPPRPQGPRQPTRAAPPVSPATPAPKPLAAPRLPPRANGAVAPRPPEEASLEVAEDAELTLVAKELFERSARLGRTYSVLGMKPEDRARVLKAVAEMSGGAVRLEGEGRSRRVVFVPDKPAPAPRRGPPDYDEEEDEG